MTSLGDRTSTTLSTATVERPSILHHLGLGGIQLRPGFQRLLVSVQLVRHADTSRFPKLRSAADVFREFRSMADLDREAFIVLLLDTKNRMTGVNVVSVGSIAASLVHPREVFKAGILANAAAVIVLHCHPSGDPTPSREDREITMRLKAAGEMIGILVLDHIVVADDGYRSFAEMGLL